MIDFNIEAQRLLSELPCRAVFRHPKSFSRLPAVSFYTLSEAPAMRADNKELVQEGYLQIDVWADKPSEVGSTAARVNEIMEKNGWLRQFSMDAKPETGGVYHRSMRFAKAVTEI